MKRECGDLFSRLKTLLKNGSSTSEVMQKNNANPVIRFFVALGTVIA